MNTINFLFHYICLSREHTILMEEAKHKLSWPRARILCLYLGNCIQLYLLIYNIPQQTFNYIRLINKHKKLS